MKSQYSAIPGRNVEINLRYCPLDGYYVMANELLNDVFSNLIGNAIKHAVPYKRTDIDIMLECIKEGPSEYYKISVEDNGPGIPDEVKSRLFTKFGRGVTLTNGKGLGLYLAKLLVESYDGRIWVEDRVLKDHTQGSRFVIILPAVICRNDSKKTQKKGA